MNSIRRITAAISLIMAFCFLPAGCDRPAADISDTVTYKGGEYVFLEYPMNIFCYYYNGSSNDHFEEVDGIYPVDSPMWDMIWNGGDLYCAKDSAAEATGYYADDENYNWYIVIDNEADDTVNYHPAELTENELNAVYSLEDKEKTVSAFWEEFEAFGSIIKISKDGMVRGTISIAKFDGSWYWKSEIINEDRVSDGTWAEFIQPLPETLDSRIKEAELLQIEKE